MIYFFFGLKWGEFVVVFASMVPLHSGHPKGFREKKNIFFGSKSFWWGESPFSTRIQLGSRPLPFGFLGGWLREDLIKLDRFFENKSLQDYLSNHFFDNVRKYFNLCALVRLMCELHHVQLIAVSSFYV